jgi:hypothetical protein
MQRKENWEVRAVFASYTQAFALQLRKKHRKTSVRVAQYKNSEVLSYTVHCATRAVASTAPCQKNELGYIV